MNEQSWNNQDVLDTLVDMKTIIDKYHIRCWIDQGTLLGIIRDNNILPNERDIDLGILYRHVKPLLYSLQDFRYMDYTTRLEGNHVTLIHNLTKFPVTFAIYQPHIDAYVHIDYPNTTLVEQNQAYWKCKWRYMVWNLHNAIAYNRLHTRWYRIERKARWFTKGSKSLQSIGKFILFNIWKMLGGEHFGYIVPKFFYDTLDSTEFRGMEFNMPTQVQQYLEYRFGTDWRTPCDDSEWDILRDDGAIIYSQEIEQLDSWHTLNEVTDLL